MLQTIKSMSLYKGTELITRNNSGNCIIGSIVDRDSWALSRKERLLRGWNYGSDLAGAMSLRT